MSWGFDPQLSAQSPFHGAAFAVIESVCKAVAAGARLADVRLTLQEYFPKLGHDAKRWGLPFAALLGAYRVQHELRLAAIGGKDSMSGSFNELDVPPTLVSFALAPGLASLAVSPEFKQVDSTVSWVEIPLGDDQLPNFKQLRAAAEELSSLNRAGKILAMHHVGRAGLAAATAKMAFGNRIGFVGLDNELARPEMLYSKRHVSFIIEHREELPASLCAVCIGKTIAPQTWSWGDESYALSELLAAWEGTLEPVYATKPESVDEMVAVAPQVLVKKSPRLSERVAQPKVIIPAFPGTNSEYDSAKAFRQAGALTDILVFRNLSSAHIESSLSALATAIRDSQILFLPGGFSAGDEPDGSAKFIATILRNPQIEDAVMDLLKNRDGLVLGICNGFQALIKTGLVPFGEIRPASEEAPTLVHNQIGRHISRYAHTRVCSNGSPWLAQTAVGDVHTIPFSHGEGKFYASPDVIAQLAQQGQIATQYCDANGVASMANEHNPNGSLGAVEGITSPCGRVLGKMGHTERAGVQVAKNIPGIKAQPLFHSGVAYFQ